MRLLLLFLSLVLAGSAAAQTIPNDPLLDEQWGLHNTGQTGGTPGFDIDAPSAWQLTTGRGFTIGILDTGIDWTHEDLAPNLWHNLAEDADGDGRTLEFIDGQWRLDPGDLNGIDDDDWDDDPSTYVDDLIGWDFVENDNDPRDTHGHGTHVAGIIAAAGDNGRGIAGVAWHARLMPLRTSRSRDDLSLPHTLDALAYALHHEVRLSNNSYGGSIFFGGAMQQALADAEAAGHLFVAAAGNGGSDEVGDDIDRGGFFPASHPSDAVLAVAATDAEDVLFPLSNFGRTAVDLAAPGDAILSTLPGDRYGLSGGTSMATAFVTGAAALVWSLNSALTAAQVKTLVLTGTEYIPGLNGKVATAGRLNAYRAVLGAATRLAVPARLDFGIVGPDQSTTRTLRIENVGAEPQTPTLAAAAPAFFPEAPTPTLPGLATTDLAITFAPDTTGVFVDTLRLRSDTLTQTVVLTGTARSLDLLTDSLAFLSTAPGNTRSQLATIYNYAATPRTATLRTDDPAFVLDREQLTVPGRQAASVRVTFAPSAPGPYAGTLTATTSDASLTVALNGTSRDQPVAAPSTTTIQAQSSSWTGTFGGPGPAGPVPTDTLVLANTGTAAMTWALNTQAFPSWLRAAPDAGTLPPGDSTAIVFEMTPEGRIPDTYEHIIQLTTDDPDRAIVAVDVQLQIPPLLPNGSQRPVWCDFDHNGDLDIAYSANERIHIGFNDGTGRFSDGPSLPDAFSNADLRCGDIDRDGSPDLLVIGTYRFQSVNYAHIAQVYRNDGAAFAPLIESPSVADPLTTRGLMDWGDFDHDGDLDLIGFDRLVVNEGDGTFSERPLDIGLRYQSFPTVAGLLSTDLDRDGDLDVLVRGNANPPDIPQRLERWVLLRNHGDGSFTPEPLATDRGRLSSAVWGDVNVDGWPDLLLSSEPASGQAADSARIFVNDGTGHLAEGPYRWSARPLTSLSWGDVNHDGRSDVVITGRRRKGTSPVFLSLYRNTGSNGFNRLDIAIPEIGLAYTVPGDADGDFDLDLLLAARGGMLYRNTTPQRNSPPQPPANLRAAVDSTTVTFRWDPATDAEGTPASLTYNLRVGTTPGGVDVLSPLSDPATGVRHVVAPGNASYGTLWRLHLPPGTYYWSVQAVDPSFVGSAFAEEHIITVDGRPRPATFRLEAPYPNPAPGAIHFDFQLPEPAAVRLRVYDVLGRRLATLADRTYPDGYHQIAWDPAGLASGLYLYHFEAGSYVQTGPLHRVR